MRIGGGGSVVDEESLIGMKKAFVLQQIVEISVVESGRGFEIQRGKILIVAGEWAV